MSTPCSRLYSRRLQFLLLAALLLSSQSAVAENSIKQWGIRWTFDKPVSLTPASGKYHYGQFVNGDYWIIGPVNIIDIDPPTHETVADEQDSNGRTYEVGAIVHGSMINPAPGDAQGYYYGVTYPISGYNAALNVATGVSALSPLAVATGSSLVSTRSRVPTGGGDQTRIQAAAVLTVLSSAPAANSFRPPYSGSDKTIKFNESDVSYVPLTSLVPVASSPALATIEASFQKVWLDHKPSFNGRWMHPKDNMPEYGLEMARTIGTAGLMLNLNFANEQKRNLLIYFVQYGIDLWGIVQAGGMNWSADGGHGQGRKFPILFAGVILDDADMKAVGQRCLTDPVFGMDYITDYLHRDYVEQWIDGEGKYPSNNTHRDHADAYYTDSDYLDKALDPGGFTVWSAGTYARNAYVTHGGNYYRCITNTTQEPGTYSNYNSHWAKLETLNGVPYLGIPEYVKNGLFSPFQGRWISRRSDASYRTPQAGQPCTVHAIVLAVHIMGLGDLWNHPPLFGYMDRHEAWLGGGLKFHRDMWTAYRKDYGPAWPSKLSSPDARTLRGRWSFVDFSGTTAKDASTYSNHATLMNDVFRTQSGSVLLNGTDHCITAATPAALNLTADLTLAAWIHPHTFGLLGDARIIDKGPRPAGFSFALDGPRHGLAYRAGDSDALSDPDVINVNQWQHVAVSFSAAAKTVTFYINGRPAGTVANYQTTPPDSDSAPLIIGNSASLTRGFKGMLTDVRVYSRALAASEIKALHDTWQVRENKPLAFQVAAEHADGTSYTYVLQPNQTLPPGVSFADGTFSWRPWYDNAGTYSFDFKVPDQPDLTQSVPVVVEEVSLTSWYRRWLQSPHR